MSRNQKIRCSEFIAKLPIQSSLSSGFQVTWYCYWIRLPLLWGLAVGLTNVACNVDHPGPRMYFWKSSLQITSQAKKECTWRRWIWSFLTSQIRIFLGFPVPNHPRASPSSSIQLLTWRKKMSMANPGVLNSSLLMDCNSANFDSISSFWALASAMLLRAPWKLQKSGFNSFKLKKKQTSQQFLKKEELVIQSDLFAMVKWPFQGVKWPPTTVGDEKGTAWITWDGSFHPKQRIRLGSDSAKSLKKRFHHAMAYPRSYTVQNAPTPSDP